MEEITKHHELLRNGDKEIPWATGVLLSEEPCSWGAINWCTLLCQPRYPTPRDLSEQRRRRWHFSRHVVRDNGQYRSGHVDDVETGLPANGNLERSGNTFSTEWDRKRETARNSFPLTWNGACRCCPPVIGLSNSLFNWTVALCKPGCRFCDGLLFAFGPAVLCKVRRGVLGVVFLGTTGMHLHRAGTLPALGILFRMESIVKQP